TVLLRGVFEAIAGEDDVSADLSATAERAGNKVDIHFEVDGFTIRPDQAERVGRAKHGPGSHVELLKGVAFDPRDVKAGFLELFANVVSRLVEADGPNAAAFQLVGGQVFDVVQQMRLTYGPRISRQLHQIG